MAAEVTAERLTRAEARLDGHDADFDRMQKHGREVREGYNESISTLRHTVFGDGNGKPGHTVRMAVLEEQVGQILAGQRRVSIQNYAIVGSMIVMLIREFFF